MRNFIELIIRYRNFLTFLVLEVVCFVLIIRNNPEQRRILFSSASLYTGKFFDVYASGLDYLDLKKENARLENENQKLKQAIQKLTGVDVIAIDTFLNDSQQPTYSYISAKIIKNSIINPDNLIAVNRGKAEGVDAHMGIIGHKGIVGITVAASEEYALAMSILHRQTRISAKLKSTDYFGSLVWRQDSDPTVMDLEDIPKHAKISIGDTVQTSGYSSMFPPGIPIGTVFQDSLQPGNNFYNIKVKLINDLSKTENVYVVKNFDQEEIKQLEAKRRNE